MSQLITHFVSASPASYAIVFAIVAIDALLPFVQAEATVITAGVLAAQGHLIVWLIVAAAALGGLIGDNAAYLLGNKVGCRAATKLLSKERLQRAERGVRRQGVVLILIARFIPVGRTATTIAAGTLRMPWRRFLAADALAATLWATYATMLGYAGGSSFAHSLWKPLLLALGVAALLAAAAEAYRRLQKHRGRDILSGEFH
jgi:membrane protein DedA with SNARE-associated domain